MTLYLLALFVVIGLAFGYMAAPYLGGHLMNRFWTWAYPVQLAVIANPVIAWFWCVGSAQ